MDERDWRKDLEEIEPARFRDVLGHFATGVTIVTAIDGDDLVGMSANSFSSVSLDPPLVLFCAALTSTTYPRIRRAGRFTISVLAEDQVDTARIFAVRGIDRFAAVEWSPAPSGGPIMDGCLAWLDCALDAEHLAGDHLIVVGRVLACEAYAMRHPLLFFRSTFGVERPAPGS